MKKRLSRLISSFHGSSCKSKADVSPPVLPPVFSLPPLSSKEETQYSAGTAMAPEIAAAPRCRCVMPRRERRRRRMSSPSIDADDVPTRPRETQGYLWRKEEKWHVVVCSEETDTERTTIEELQDDEDDDDDKEIPWSITELTETRLRRRISNSSCDSSFRSTSEDEANDEEEDYEDDETSTLLSSLSFATNAEEVNVNGSFAVVKKSEDPRGDFRRSMAEMVAEKGMYEAGDLEQLLRCFLSLNSRRHHRDIVAAFTDIWESLFPENPPTKGYRQ